MKMECNVMIYSRIFHFLTPFSCVDCQSRYFDCEFDQNDNDTTRQDHSDGGLGAGNFNYGTVCYHLNTLAAKCL